MHSSTTVATSASSASSASSGMIVAAAAASTLPTSTSAPQSVTQPEEEDGEDLTCPSCCCTFTDPLQLATCSHHMCKACVKQWTEHTKQIVAASVESSIDLIGLTDPDVLQLLHHPRSGLDLSERCSFCQGTENDHEMLVFCDRCEIAVHAGCYHITSIPPDDEPWYCEPCTDVIEADGSRPNATTGGKKKQRGRSKTSSTPTAAASSSSTSSRSNSRKHSSKTASTSTTAASNSSLRTMSGAKCSVCDNVEDGALKRLADGSGYIHLSCASFLPGPEFDDEFSATPVSHLEDIPPVWFKQKCMYCDEFGATVQCQYKKCLKTYHVPCGLRNGCLFSLKCLDDDEVHKDSVCVVHRKNVREVANRHDKKLQLQQRLAKAKGKGRGRSGPKIEMPCAVCRNISKIDLKHPHLGLQLDQALKARADAWKAAHPEEEEELQALISRYPQSAPHDHDSSDENEEEDQKGCESFGHILNHNRKKKKNSNPTTPQRKKKEQKAVTSTSSTLTSLSGSPAPTPRKSRNSHKAAIGADSVAERDTESDDSPAPTTKKSRAKIAPNSNNSNGSTKPSSLARLTYHHQSTSPPPPPYQSPRALQSSSVKRQLIPTASTSTSTSHSSTQKMEIDNDAEDEEQDEDDSVPLAVIAAKSRSKMKKKLVRVSSSFEEESSESDDDEEVPMTPPSPKSGPHFARAHSEPPPYSSPIKTESTSAAAAGTNHLQALKADSRPASTSSIQPTPSRKRPRPVVAPHSATSTGSHRTTRGTFDYELDGLEILEATIVSPGKAKPAQTKRRKLITPPTQQQTIQRHDSTRSHISATPTMDEDMEMKVGNGRSLHSPDEDESKQDMNDDSEIEDEVANQEFIRDQEVLVTFDSFVTFFQHESSSSSTTSNVIASTPLTSKQQSKLQGLRQSLRHVQSLQLRKDSTQVDLSHLPTLLDSLDSTLHLLFAPFLPFTSSTTSPISTARKSTRNKGQLSQQIDGLLATVLDPLLAIPSPTSLNGNKHESQQKRLTAIAPATLPSPTLSSIPILPPMDPSLLTPMTEGTTSTSPANQLNSQDSPIDEEMADIMPI